MKWLIAIGIIICVGFITQTEAQVGGFLDSFVSKQLASSTLENGNILRTDGRNSEWVPASTILGSLGNIGLDFNYNQDIGFGLTGSATNTKTFFESGVHASTTSRFENMVVHNDLYVLYNFYMNGNAAINQAIETDYTLTIGADTSGAIVSYGLYRFGATAAGQTLFSSETSGLSNFNIYAMDSDLFSTVSISLGASSIASFTLNFGSIGNISYLLSSPNLTETVSSAILTYTYVVRDYKIQGVNRYGLLINSNGTNYGFGVRGDVLNRTIIATSTDSLGNICDFVGIATSTVNNIGCNFGLVVEKGSFFSSASTSVLETKKAYLNGNTYINKSNGVITATSTYSFTSASTTLTGGNFLYSNYGSAGTTTITRTGFHKPVSIRQIFCKHKGGSSSPSYLLVIGNGSASSTTLSCVEAGTTLSGININIGQYGDIFHAIGTENGHTQEIIFSVSYEYDKS